MNNAIDDKYETDEHDANYETWECCKFDTDETDDI